MWCPARVRFLPWPSSLSLSLSRYCVPDYFGNVVFFVNATTGMITMNPILPPFEQNLNYESGDPNPFVLRLQLTGVLGTAMGIWTHLCFAICDD